MGRRVAVHCDVRDAGNREGGLGSGHARGKGMSGAGTGPLSIGIIWGIVGTAKYWRNIWHLFIDPYPRADT